MIISHVEDTTKQGNVLTPNTLQYTEKILKSMMISRAPPCLLNFLADLQPHIRLCLIFEKQDLRKQLQYQVLYHSIIISVFNWI